MRILLNVNDKILNILQFLLFNYFISFNNAFNNAIKLEIFIIIRAER